MNTNPFCFSVFYFVRGGRHLRSGPSIMNDYPFCSQSQSCTSSIQSGVSSSDDSHLFTQSSPYSQIKSSQKIYSGIHSFSIFTRNLYFHSTLSPNSQKDCFKSLLLELF